ncbi:MAG: YggS family pyridoxal phosphate-dependent enzyme [Bacteroidales bacterium]|nr:YggS family pyridoxal phosphate-dependent enzyme [Bacteroidales bacterium]
MNVDKYQEILREIPQNVQLIAVSKLHPASEVEAAYALGQRDFGENWAQEMREKHEILPQDIRWHFIGHLQTNKIKYIIPYVYRIHSIDSFKLLQEVNRQAEKHNRVVGCLLQFHIATEETKFGFSMDECEQMLKSPEFSSLKNVDIKGVMGMASFTDDTAQVRREFQTLHGFFTKLKEEYFSGKTDFTEISMGMTGDYPIAIEEGSTMIRVGSAIFGARDYSKH